jgi:hypothetical protein
VFLLSDLIMYGSHAATAFLLQRNSAPSIVKRHIENRGPTRLAIKMVMFEWSGVNAARVGICRHGAQPKGTMIAATHCLVPTVHSADGP